MPGFYGILTNEGGADLGRRFEAMAESVVSEPFYISGAYADDSLGLRFGWNGPSEAFMGPQWNEAGTVALFLSGDMVINPSERSGLAAQSPRLGPEASGHLMHLCEEDRIKLPVSLNGRFAGLIIDLRKRALVLFNDRFGLERVYWRQTGHSFYFASEAKAILAACPELKEIDSIGLAETFSCGCTLQDRTVFSGISLVPGASIWQIERGREIRRSRYFRPHEWEDVEPLAPLPYYARLKDTWRAVLPRYLAGPKRTAMSLTGGKDSRMIMSWSQAAPGDLPCYTFGSMYRESQDVKLAREIARLAGQPHRVITVGDRFLDDFPALAERTVRLTDGAMDVSGAVELYANRLAREIAPIRLTGNYGQEILRRAVAFRPMPFDERALDPQFAQLVRSAETTYAAERKGHPLSFIAFKQVPWFHRCRLSLELTQLVTRSPFLDNDLVALAYRQPRDLETQDRIQLRLIAEGSPALAALETDRGISAKGSDMSGPIRRMMKTLSFKAEYAYDYGMPGAISGIDSALKGLHLERLFLGRHKFYHFRVWYRDRLHGYVRDILLDRRARSRPYLDGRRLEAMVNSHIRGSANLTLEIHRLLTAELLHRQFID